MRPLQRYISIAFALCAAATLTSCEREYRWFNAHAPGSQAVRAEKLVEIEAGGPALEPAKLGILATAEEPPKEYEENAYMLSEGKRLFSYFNCVNCHAHGGGSIGPALMDSNWFYGHKPEQIFHTIVDGRPNGMPSFGGKIASHQVWQLVAYVRSMSGLVPRDAAPSRNDDMNVGLPENSRETMQPSDSPQAKTAEGPP
jgi:cytochrome c oxidase cbb3-type subunit III